MNTSVPKTGKLVPMPLTTGLDALTVVNQIVGAVTEWVQVHETETTKRELIGAQESIVISEIQARRELFVTYLDRSFDERERTFNELFRALDRAMDSDPTAIAGIGMVDKGHQHIALAAAAIDKSGQGIGIAQTAGFKVGTGIGLAAAQRAIGASDGQRGHKFRHHRRGRHR